MRAITFLLLAGIACSLQAAGQARVRLYLGNDDHTDYIWTANEARYDSAFGKMLDYYLAQIDATRHLPDDAQTRFTADGSYWLYAYGRTRTARDFDRLAAAIRSGHISVPLNLLVSCYGGQPTEAVLRGMYHAGQMERRLGVRFSLALAMENQTLPLGLGALWAGCGAKYSWRGVCACASRLSKTSLAKRRHWLYRYAGLDGSSVLMKWYPRRMFGNRVLGGYADARWPYAPQAADSAAPSFIAAMDTLACSKTYPYAPIGVFGFGGDDLETFVGPAFQNLAQTYSTPGRQVRVSNQVDFFEDVARHYPNLPTDTVSYGNEWDTYYATMQEVTARVRRSVEKLRTAEALAAVASLRKPGFAKGLHEAKQQAWRALGLYWEHDWTADGPVPQADRARWQIKIQQQISAYVDSLYNLAAHEVGAQAPAGRHPRFYVFNPLGWERNGVADFPYEGPSAVRVVEVSTRMEVPCQIVTQSGNRYLRIAAKRIPSVGYQVYEVRPAGNIAPLPTAILRQKSKAPLSLPAGGGRGGLGGEGEVSRLENRYYSLRLSGTGAITSLLDKATGRELVQTTNGRALNDLGGGEEAGVFSIENPGPVSKTLKVSSHSPVPHTVRVTLYAHSPRIDIENSITENFADLKTWAFSFNLNNPIVRHEELGAILTARKEHRGGHYAAQNARYDWLTFNHFADISEPGYGVTLSNQDCSFFKLGGSTPDSLWEGSAQINALAGGHTDVLPQPGKDSLRLGIAGQFGQRGFAYAFSLQPHAGPFDATAAMRMALEHQNPLVAAPATWADIHAPKRFTLLTSYSPNLILWSLKPAEEGAGQAIVARFWHMGNAAQRQSITLHAQSKKVWQTTHIETHLHTVPLAGSTISQKFAPHQMQTFKWVLK